MDMICCFINSIHRKIFVLRCDLVNLSFKDNERLLPINAIGKCCQLYYCLPFVNTRLSTSYSHFFHALNFKGLAIIQILNHLAVFACSESFFVVQFCTASENAQGNGSKFAYKKLSHLCKILLRPRFCLKSDSHLPFFPFFLLQRNPSKSDKKCFLFHFKSSFRS